MFIVLVVGAVYNGQCIDKDFIEYIHLTGTYVYGGVYVGTYGITWVKSQRATVDKFDKQHNTFDMREKNLVIASKLKITTAVGIKLWTKLYWHNLRSVLTSYNQTWYIFRQIIIFKGIYILFNDNWRFTTFYIIIY